MKMAAMSSFGTALVCSLLFSACALDAGPEDVEAVASTNEAIAAPTCNVGSAANATAVGRSYTSPEIPAGYGSSGCPGRFVLEVDDATPILGGAVQAFVEPWTAPSSAAACEATFASIDVWGWVPGRLVGKSILPGDWVKLGSSQGSGTWSAASGFIPGGCSLNVGEMGVTTYGSYATYRVTAEVTQTVSNGRSTYTTAVPLRLSFEEPGTNQ